MRCQLIAVVFAAAAAAGPLKVRDLPTVQAAFAAVSAALNTSDIDVQAINANSNQAATIKTLTADSAAVISALSTGSVNINATSALTNLDALGLIQPGQALLTTTNNTINDLIAKHDFVAASGQSAQVVTSLEAQRAGTSQFIDSVASKVPAALVSAVQQNAASAVAIINRGIVAYGGTV